MQQEPLSAPQSWKKAQITEPVTNINGEFTLNVSPGATLVISYIGYKDHVITVDNQDFITISMVEDTQKLNEVVVVGYGTQKK